ncbi:LOW QUALITY PROTEIN: probable flavin-containing monooxygenase 1 [Asparagus officinalis]|uniref:LOW QUALITY PROTEIN: probable flavin-containing monooxygenase 1 n=1 Tax=Asparagus officinalis TaxID=4686 RepID=UPI00098E5950|nr:LOW QUALITY PROTEIN: probable flavin-containing monooxygenase 1 [Asparagus officinalis]
MEKPEGLDAPAELNDGVPNIPKFPVNKGSEVFNGKVIHSMEHSDKGSSRALELIRRKRVNVVKSAIDIAAERGNVNVLRFFDARNGVAITCMSYGSYAVAAGIPITSSCCREISYSLIGVNHVISKFAESYCKCALPLKMYGMVPEHSFFQAISSGLVALHLEKFYDKVEEGSIVLRKSRNFSFCKNGVMIDGQASPIETDIPILATGYKSDQKITDVFSSALFKKNVAGSLTATSPLYRECIYPLRIPQLAIIGYSESVSNLHTSELRSKCWLAQFLDGDCLLPRIMRMEENVKEWEKYMKRCSGEFLRKPRTITLNTWNNDQLCRGMGCSPRRKNGVFG